MQNKLKGWIAPNSVTKDPNDKILILDPAGHVGMTEIYKEMREEDTGLRPETLTHVVTLLFERIVARFLMNGYYVNTGLFYAVPPLLRSHRRRTLGSDKEQYLCIFYPRQSVT